MIAVSVEGVPVIQVRVGGADVRGLLGRGGRVARSLRTLLDCIGERQGVEYLLDIQGRLLEPEGYVRKAKQRVAAGAIAKLC